MAIGVAIISDKNERYDGQTERIREGLADQHCDRLGIDQGVLEVALQERLDVEEEPLLDRLIQSQVVLHPGNVCRFDAWIECEPVDRIAFEINDDKSNQCHAKEDHWHDQEAANNVCDHNL